MGNPYAVQLGDKVAAARRVLTEVVPESAWLDPFASAESGFRNRAKLVVAGDVGAATLGILDAGQRGVDLQDCGIHETSIKGALPVLADFIDDLRLLPYDVPKRRGELKHLHVTSNPVGELMVRFVLRTDRQSQRIIATLPQLHVELPGLRVATINHLPEHVALLEGDREDILTEQRTLAMDLGRVTLQLGPKSFFQTNTAVAQGLYETARAWLEDSQPGSLVDLYCGVGGFGLYAATLPTPPSVIGVEVSDDAIASARHTLKELRKDEKAPGSVEFVAADATTAAGRVSDADCVIVNPPRRGIGADLATTIQRSAATTLVYSSCNPETLARDLAAMPGFTVTKARLFDMFPQTGHSEVLVLAQR